jgi:DNA-binding transcriptional ArsR family regulator
MTVFDAVADPTRRRLLRHLRQAGPLTLTQLAEPLPMSRQAVTKHLHVLEQAGLVRVTRQGRSRLHDLDDAPLRELYHWLEPYAQAWGVQVERPPRHAKNEEDRGP